jgi:hypothetical protein
MSVREHKCPDLLRQSIAIAQQKSLVPRLHPTVAIDQETSGHPPDAELLGKQAVAVIDDAKVRGVLAQETVGIGALSVDVDCNDNQAVVSDSLCRWFIQGNDSRQGAHQEAQKSR